MAGYSGKATIAFSIERVLDQDGKYRPVQPGDDLERVEELELSITGRSLFSPGNYSGPPGDCYEDDYETEILQTLWNGTAWNGSLTDKEEEEILMQLDTAVAESGYDESDYQDEDD